MRRAAALLAGASFGCTPFDAGLPSNNGGEPAMSEPDGAAPRPPGTEQTPTTPPIRPSDGGAPVCAVDSFLAGDACVRATSCADLQKRDPKAITGVHPIALRGQEILVHCDMNVDNGGWTLVGRSVRGAASTSFGWFAATGSAAADGAPYSLDVTSLAFTEVMITNYTDGKNVDQGFAFKLDPAAVAGAKTTEVSLTARRVVHGDCKPSGSGFMLQRAGYTAQKSIFYFRDVTSTRFEGFGLNADLYNLADGDCNRQGALHKKPGMVFVR